MNTCIRHGEKKFLYVPMLKALVIVKYFFLNKNCDPIAMVKKFLKKISIHMTEHLMRLH